MGVSTSPPETEFKVVYPIAIRRLILSTALIVCLVLVGWVLHIETLKRIAPGLSSMNPLTAVGFALSCAALWCLKDGPAAGRRRGLVVLLGSLVLLIGLSRLADVSFGTTLCPDGLLFRSQLDQGQAFPSRISPNAAMCFCLLGVALLTLDRRDWPRFLHPQLLILPLLALVWTAIVGYAYNTSGFYRYRQFIPMALHTALCFMLLAVALILSRPAEGFMHWIPRGSIGARSFRRLLPACVLVPLVLGAAQLAGAGAGKLNPEAGASLASVATTLVMAVLAFLTALSLNRLDARRYQADLDLQARQELERRTRQWALSIGELEELIRVGRDDLPGNAVGIIGMLVNKVGALQGGLYMTETAPEAAPRLRVLALYAYDSPQQLERSFGIGEGLVGQCAAGRKPLHVDAVPPDYFRLRSMHIDVLPRHLLLLPILLDEEVLGVLELACAEPLAEEVLRFLNSALRVLAFGIYRYSRMQQARRQGAELERLRVQQALRT